MERRFNTDFRAVRVHTDAPAHEFARWVNAEAFTVGRNIVFGAGHYEPATERGKHLIAHELTHVVQQEGDVVRSHPAPWLAPTGMCQKGDEQLRINHSGNQHVRIQRWHIENGRKAFDCPAYDGDHKLEACLNDEDRLRPFETGLSVRRLQAGLLSAGEDLGRDGMGGIYGADTGQAVMAFKRRHNLGFSQYPDVGPGTMGKLDELCAASGVPPRVELPTGPPPFPNLPPPISPWHPPGPEKPPDTPAHFCVPYSDRQNALSNWAWVYPAMMQFVSRFGSDVQDLWRTYLTNPKTGPRGTLPPRRVFGDQNSRIVNEFRNDIETRRQTDRIMRLIAERVASDPALMPQPGFSTPLMNFRDILSDSEVQDLPMTFTNGDSRIPGNIAGGYARNASDAGDDVRNVDGKFVAINLGLSTLRIQATFVFDVLDCVDFCPGAPGDWRAQFITVPMSRLEATPGVPTYDVPFEVIYGLFDDQYY